jgi:hypothetical protein
LRAEEARIGRQLSHERDLRELEHLRGFFDVAAVFQEALEATRHYGALVQENAQLRHELVDAASAAVEAGSEMNILHPGWVCGSRSTIRSPLRTKRR